MSKFKMDALVSWARIAPGQILGFDCGDGRRVSLTLLANAPLEVWAGSVDGPEVLLGTADRELLDIEFSAQGEVFLTVLSDEDAAIFQRGYAPDQAITAEEEENFTTILPRQRRNSDLDRMMMLTKLNESRREAQLNEALRSMQEMQAAMQAAQPASAPAAPADEKVVE